MANTGQIVAAIREMASTKNLSHEEMNELIRDGLLAGLGRIYGPNVRAEIEIDEVSGDIEMIVLKRVVAEVEDGSAEISLEKARWDDPTYEVGDVMEIPVDFSEFGWNAVTATKNASFSGCGKGSASGFGTSSTIASANFSPAKCSKWSGARSW